MRAILMLSLLSISCGDKTVQVVNTPPAVTISSPPNGSEYDQYNAIEFYGTVNDAQQPSDSLELTWSSDIDGVLNTDFADTTGNAVLVTSSLSPGNHIITLEAMDDRATNGNDFVELVVIDVEDAPSLTIRHPLPDEFGTEGLPTNFEVVVSDGQDDLNALVVIIESDVDGELCNDLADETGLFICDEVMSIGAHILSFTVFDTSNTSASEILNYEVLALVDIDNDGDGFSESEGDCDDTDSSIYPAAEEFPNEVDDDCDEIIDEGTSSYDDDGDCYCELEPCLGTIEPSCIEILPGDCDDNRPSDHPGAVESCDNVDNNCNGQIDEGTVCIDDDLDGYSEIAGDCDDENPFTYPFAQELPDGLDNDCDNTIDEETSAYDDDGDCFCEIYFNGSCSGSIEPNCSTLLDGDCEDADDSIFPTAIELCDGIDNNCDSSIDDPSSADAQTWYNDADTDYFGDPANWLIECYQPLGYVLDGTDCNDGEPLSNPSLVESCDGIDNDCDLIIDNGVLTTYYEDFDSDTHGNPLVSQDLCSQPNGYVTTPDDCDDSEPLAWTNAPEVCDNVDNDCNGNVDDGVLSLFYADSDIDTYGDPNVSVEACSQPSGYVLDNTDCNDSDGTINPLTYWYYDNDNDQYGGISFLQQCTQPAGYVDNNDDCNDSFNTAYPGAVEYCDNIDNNCDNVTDEGTAVDALVWYEDVDGDNFAGSSNSQTSCAQPPGFYLQSTDCNDGDPSIFPGAGEVCDGLDNNCNTTVDEGVTTTYYLDSDSDNYGDSSQSQEACNAPSGYVTDNQDCDDSQNGVNPGATEVCDNGIDNDCDNVSDDDDPSLAINSTTTFYYDSDNDSYGGNVSIQRCVQPSNYVLNNSDCNDNNGSTYPGATEYCDGADNNCDNVVDESSSIDALTWYYDSDGDNFAGSNTTTLGCSQPNGYYSSPSDCNDSDNTIFPGAAEICDSVDNNCNTTIDEGVTTTYYLDGDSDGFGSPSLVTNACTTPNGYVTNNTDCNDGNGAINPNASEICDSLDNDCDNSIDDADNSLDLNTAPYWYSDSDYDTYGNPNVSLHQCSQPNGYVTNNTDCNDSTSSANPGANEVCDGIDNDCDTSIDETNASGCSTYYYDGDGDGYGSTNSQCLCSPSGNYDTTNNSDCYDSNSDARPGQSAWYTTHRGDNNFDYDCNGSQTKRYNGGGGCGGWPGCSTNNGWNSGNPSCGNTGPWVTGCSTDWFSCDKNTSNRTQECH